MTNKKRKYVEEVIQVNISTPFTQRTKCKFCCGGPSFYYYLRSSLFLDPKTPMNFISWIKKHYYRMCSDDYLFDSPKDFTDLSHLSYDIPYMNYSAILHRTRGVSQRRNFIQYLGCDCGKTKWAFYYASAANRPEIINRKGRTNLPYKYKF